MRKIDLGYVMVEYLLGTEAKVFRKAMIHQQERQRATLEVHVRAALVLVFR